MPNINLIAVRREEKKRLERMTRQLFFGLSGAIGLFAVLTLYLGARQLQVRSELADANEKMQKLQPVLDRIAQIEKDTSELSPKVETLESAKLNTLRWRAVLQVVSQSIPENTWLAGLSTAGTSEDTSINLAGMTSSQTMVGDTMTRLGTHPLFDKVDLKFTQTEAGAKPDDPIQRVRFEILAHLRSNEPAKDGKDGPNKERIRQNLKDRKEAVSQAAPASQTKKEGIGHG